jgi:hypothetical protein
MPTTGACVSCPPGFVIHDNPNDPRVIYPEGSASAAAVGSAAGGLRCAYACQLPGYFTEETVGLLRRIVVVASAIGLPMISLVVFTWVTSKLRMQKQV